jgi:pyruvate,orthophosphate dikinase
MSTEPQDEQLAARAEKYVYFFGGGKMKDVLGGKGAGLAEMTNAGLPVPPGFTIQTEACREYLRHGAASKVVDRQMDEALAKLEAVQGQKFGEGGNPLQVSVRAGGKFAMPGRMGTISNVGRPRTSGSWRSNLRGDTLHPSHPSSVRG